MRQPLIRQWTSLRAARFTDVRKRAADTASCVVAALIVSGSMAVAAPPKTDSGDWKIEIRPREDVNAPAVAAPATAVTPQAHNEPALPTVPPAAVSTQRMTYAQAMAAIPFNREEYEANPSYRHDAALELMFGTLRPTMVVKQNIPYFSRYPDFFRNRFQVFPYLNGHGSSMNMFSNWSMNTYMH